MILLLSEENCESTNLVIDWLIKFNANYFRINKSDNCQVKSISTSNNLLRIILCINKKSLDLSKINAVWHRRPGINLTHSIPKFKNLPSTIRTHLSIHLSGELHELNNFILYYLGTKKTIGTPGLHHINKLKCLDIANKIGLKIPKTKIFTRKDAMPVFNSMITKSIRNNPIIRYKSIASLSVTSRVPNALKKSISLEFFPSLIQEEIIKDFEIRVFFLNDLFYAMAIFSQGNPNTEVDFRNLNKGLSNRNCSYILPKFIEHKLRILLHKIGLNSASIDLIKTKQNEFYFLEINPVGQFGMVSYPCNYYLEKIIAQTLVNYDKNNKQIERHTNKL